MTASATGKLYTGREFELLSQSEFDNLSTSEQLTYLVQFGVLAPTTHNTVPERFKIKNDRTISLFLDRNAVLPASDVKGRQAVISIGCVAEQIRQAAAEYGWRTELIFPEELPTEFTHLEPDATERFIKIVTLQFHPDKTVKPIVDIEILKERRVLRAEYDASVKFEEAVHKKLETILKVEFPDLHLNILTQPLVMRGMGKFQEQADRFVMENQKFAHELGEWLLPNSDQKTAVGMRGYEFGLDDAFSEHIHSGLLGNTRLTPDQISFFARGGKTGIDSSSAIIVLSVKKDDLISRFRAGQAYVLLSVLAQQAGFYHAVHAGITEVDWVNRAFATTILKTSQRPTVVFRLGKPKRTDDLHRTYSSRPLVKDLLLTKL